MQKFCNECKVSVSTKTHVCPLCKTPFETVNEVEECETYPAYVQKTKPSHLLTKICFFVAFISIGGCVFFNLTGDSSVLWCVIAAAGILYAWLIVQFTFMTKINLGLKLLTHAVALPVLIAIINMFSDSEIARITWALSYAIPFILIAFTITITITVACTKMRWRDYTLYMISIAFLGFIPLIVALFIELQPYWPNIAAAAYSFATLLGMFLFMDRRTKNELRKRFHL